MAEIDQADVPALFAAQLQSTADLFTWAALAIPVARLRLSPLQPAQILPERQRQQRTRPAQLSRLWLRRGGRQR